MSLSHPPAGGNPGSADPLLPKHRNDLRESGLSDEQIVRCGFYSISDAGALGKLLRWPRPAGAHILGPCLAIPFHDVDGKPLDYVRFKPDRPRLGKDGKAIKYESSMGRPNRAYIPPGTRTALADPDEMLFITEGEKKAAKADQEGFPCIGLVGVYGWQQKRLEGSDGAKTGTRKLIPDLAGVKWANRQVRIVYDSDIVEKNEVRVAEWHLAEALRAAGANVRVIRLPAEPDGSKNGLDDYLHRHGRDTLRQLIETSVPPADPEATGRNCKTEKIFSGSQLRPWPTSPAKRAGTPVKGPSPYVPFPVKALAAPLWPFVEAVAAAIPCDPAAVALPALVACGAAIGMARVLSIKNSWTEPPILWGVLVARSGAVKSPPVEHAITPLQTIDLELRRASINAIRAQKEAEAARKNSDKFDKLAEKTRERRAKSKKPIPPTPNEPASKSGASLKLIRFEDELHCGSPLADGENAESSVVGAGPPARKLRCVVGDITVESIAVVLEDNPKGVLVYRDELASWFNALSRYSKSDTTSDWLTLFHGRGLTVDRKTPVNSVNTSMAVPNAAAALVGTIQPKVLGRAFTPEFRSSDGAARLLLVMTPPRRKIWSEMDVPQAESAAYEQIIRRLRALELEKAHGRTFPMWMPFTDAARKRWGEFVNEWGQLTFEAGEDDEDLAAAFSKLEGYAARFALIHHLVTQSGLSSPVTAEPVGLDSLESGIALAKWFANEAERVYALLVEDDQARLLRELTDCVRRLGGRVTIRDLQKSNSRRYRAATAAEADLNKLVAAGLGLWEENRPESGGHSKREFVLCPTDDGSDTRSEGGEHVDADPSDTRPLGPAKNSEKPADLGRLSEASHVGREGSSENSQHGPVSPGSSSVEPKPKSKPRRRYENDDRPHESRG